MKREVRRLTGVERFSGAAGVLLVLLLGAACSEPRTYRPVPGKQTQAGGSDLLALRADKDRMFKSSSDSPIPAGDQPGFTGLSYYPPDPAYRFRLKLNRFPVPEQVRLGTNTGEMREALRYGYFEFQIDGQLCRLHAYRTEESAVGPPRLFIPFRDATSKDETYPAGRYLEITENTTGEYVLDLNMAFNPYCAYNSSFSCPVPPAENVLQVAIRAGEKRYPLARSHRE